MLRPVADTQTTYNSAVEYDGVIEYARRSSIWSWTDTAWDFASTKALFSIPNLLNTSALSHSRFMTNRAFAVRFSPADERTMEY